MNTNFVDTIEQEIKVLALLTVKPPTAEFAVSNSKAERGEKVHVTIPIYNSLKKRNEFMTYRNCLVLQKGEKYFVKTGPKEEDFIVFSK